MAKSSLYKLAEIFPKKNRTLKQRWYILFYATNQETGQLQAGKTIWIPNFDTIKERTDWAKNQIQKINEFLIKGYTFKTEENAKTEGLTVHSKLTDVIRQGLSIVQKENIVQKAKLEKSGLSEKKRKTNGTYTTACKVFELYLKEKKMENVTLYQFSYQKDKLSYTQALKFRDYLIDIRANSNRTVNNIISYLRSLLNKANRRNNLEDNVFAKIPKLKISIGRNVAFSPQEKTAIIEKVKQEDQELYLYICFMYYCMFRKEEVRFLKVSDISADSIYINELISKNTKGEFVTIPNHFNKILDELKVREKPKDSFVFHKTGYPKTPRANNYFYNKHIKVLQSLNVNPQSTMHSWRHTSAVDAHNANIPVGFIQNQLRHKSLETTVIYLKSLGLSISKEIKHNFPEL